MSREALEVFAKLCVLDPDSAHSHFVLGRAQYQEKEFAAALASFDKCLAIDPQYLIAILLSAQAHEQLGRVEMARSLYEQGVKKSALLGDEKFGQQFHALLSTL